MNDTKRDFSYLIKYNEKLLQKHIDDTERLLKSKEQKNINSISYYFENRRLSKYIVELKVAQETLEDLMAFRPSWFYINSNLITGINAILPFLDFSDSEKIKNVFYGGITELRKKDEQTLKKIKDNSSKFLNWYTEDQKVTFFKFYNEQKRLFLEHNYLKSFNFNTNDADNKIFMQPDTNYLLNTIIPKLVEKDRLNNKYVKDNLNEIKNACILKDKADFVNSKIEELLIMDDTTSDIDIEKLKVILRDIKEKNQKIITNAQKILDKINVEELESEYKKVLEEESESQKHKESLEIYERLMYEYLKAEKEKNSENMGIIRARLYGLNLSEHEKAAIDIRLEERLRREEAERMKAIEERDNRRKEASRRKKELEELKKIAISNLAKSGKLDETEHTIAGENGEFKTTVDTDKRDALISQEMDRIKQEESDGHKYKR